jgi:tetratricopeptide (TPR) repeat protein
MREATPDSWLLTPGSLNSMIKRTLLLLLTFFFSGCQTSCCKLEPEICYIPPKQFVEYHPTAFPPLDIEERRQDWAKELIIANGFASEIDFYRAITSFKRALFLTPKKYAARRLQMQYGIIQSYYLAGRFQDTIETFEASSLTDCPPDFPALDDLLILLYDSYKRIENEVKASCIMALIQSRNQSQAKLLKLSEAVRAGELCDALVNAAPESTCETDTGIPTVSPASQILYQETYCFVKNYEQQKKSIRKAQFLNAVLPGAGYIYVGQKVSGITSFWLNSLFIAAAYYCFDHNNIAAGLILSSFEFGWYFGGINGAGLAAKEYNEHLYNTTGKEFLLKNVLFPVLMLKYTF